jgi:hypothetical protein
LLEELAGPVPALVVAVTVKIYEVPLVKPETVMGDPLPVPVIELGVDVAVYCVSVAP